MRATKATTWTLFAAGVALAIGSRFGGPAWGVGTGLALIGMSMWVDVLPGGSQLSAIQSATLQRIGIPDPQRAHRLASSLLGAALIGGGAYWLLR